MNPARVVAEIGCNHKGDLDIAKEMVAMAKNFCKVGIVKFQKRTIRECLSLEEYERPHPIPYNAYGNTYGKHREILELSIEEHGALKKYCDSLGLEYSASVWDLTSAKEISALKPRFIKVPSACNTHWEMLEYLCMNHEEEIHVSLGMTTHEEELEMVAMYERFDRLKDVVLYACTSGYPVDAKDVCLLEITRLKDAYAGRVKAIGFSGHHLGISIDIAALTLGAEWIERHYTLDRTWKGTDHAASLEPDGLRRLARDIAHVSKAMQKKGNEILEVEIKQRNKLKWDRDLAEI